MISSGDRSQSQKLGRRTLCEVAKIVTPYTLLACHQTLIAQKYIRSITPWPGTTSTCEKVQDLVVRTLCRDASKVAVLMKVSGCRPQR
jgi:hypothetical protein